MKAMALTGIRQMAVMEVPDPRIGCDTDVLIRVGVVGVCGSDVHYYVSGKIGSQIVKYPYRVGHEFAGIVEDTGKGVKRVKRGDRVAVDPAISCGECDQCRTGRPHTCRTLRFLGCPGQAEGCLSEYIVMPEECCFPVSQDMTLEKAALAEPLSIGLYSTLFLECMTGACIGILGCGPIGLSVLLSAIAGGAEKIYVTDKIDSRLNVAKGAGACWTGNPDRQDVVTGVVASEPGLLDAVFECCGSQEALDQAIQLLKPGGKLMIVGIPSEEKISFSIDSIRRKEICIQNVRRQNDCMQAAVDLIQNGRANVDFMLTHRFPFKDTKKAFDVVAGYQEGVVKAMIILDQNIE